jgi:hypothetical protein
MIHRPVVVKQPEIAEGTRTAADVAAVFERNEMRVGRISESRSNIARTAAGTAAVVAGAASRTPGLGALLDSIAIRLDSGAVRLQRQRRGLIPASRGKLGFAYRRHDTPQ